MKAKNIDIVDYFQKRNNQFITCWLVKSQYVYIVSYNLRDIHKGSKSLN